MLEYADMDPELKRLMQETHALAHENHRILRAMRRDQWVGFVSKTIFWLIVFILPLYFYQQYLQPIVARFSVMSGIATSTSNGLGLPTTVELQKLIDSYKVKP